MSVRRVGLKHIGALTAALMLASCQTNPKQTVLNLDTTDRKWASRECVAARKAVYDYNDGERLRGVAGLANYVVPYVGTAVSTALNLTKDPQRERLNAIVRTECVTPKRKAQSASARARGRY